MDAQTKARQLVQVVMAFVETIKEAGPNGAPEGPMYLAFMQHGGSLESFESMMVGLEKVGIIRRSGHVAFYTGK